VTFPGMFGLHIVFTSHCEGGHIGKGVIGPIRLPPPSPFCRPNKKAPTPPAALVSAKVPAAKIVERLTCSFSETE
jgi:hypothetical protein